MTCFPLELYYVSVSTVHLLQQEGVRNRTPCAQVLLASSGRRQWTGNLRQDLSHLAQPVAAYVHVRHL